MIGVIRPTLFTLPTLSICIHLKKKKGKKEFFTCLMFNIKFFNISHFHHSVQGRHMMMMIKFFSHSVSLWCMFAPVDIIIGAYGSIFKHPTRNQSQKNKNPYLPTLFFGHVMTIKPFFFWPNDTDNNILRRVCFLINNSTVCIYIIIINISS